MGPDGGHWGHDGGHPVSFETLPPVAQIVFVLIALQMCATLWFVWRYVVGTFPRRPRVDVRRRWSDAVARHRKVGAAYAAYECDAAAVLRLPALADVRLAPTAHFVEAFAEAGALLTELYPGPELARRFAAAVEGEQRAWDAARDAARRFADARFDPDERALIDQVRTLLDIVSSSEFEPERLAAWGTVRRRLAELERRTGWRLPAPAALAVEVRARAALATAPSHR